MSDTEQADGEAGPREQGEAAARKPSEEEQARLAGYGIVRLRADNPGPLSLSGTNTWVLDRDPAFVVDPGPALSEHLDALTEQLRQRGGLGGIVLTHDHPDHCEAVQELRERMPAPLAAARAKQLRHPGDVTLKDGEGFGPLVALATPGHAPDHLALIYRTACFTGDAVLGEGSVFIAPDEGALAGYLAALQRLMKLPLQVLCPGHGPPIWEPQARLAQYLEHRLDRERMLLQALSTGARSTTELLDAAWADVPEPMRPFAAVTLTAHLDKLSEEGRLPAGVQRPSHSMPREA